MTVLGRCALAGAASGILPAVLIFQHSRLDRCLDFVFLLATAAATGGVGGIVAGAIPAWLLRRRPAGRSRLPGFLFAVLALLYPAGALAVDLMLRVRYGRVMAWSFLLPEWAPWGAYAAGGAVCLSWITAWGARSLRRAAAVAAAGFLFLGAVYLGVRTPGWEDTGVHRPALGVYPHPVRTRPGGPVLVVCADGGTWDVLDPLLASGKLPALAKLADASARGVLRSTPPYSSQSCWTTIFTGKERDRHGIGGHLVVQLPGVRPFRLTPRDRDNYAVLGIGALLARLGIAEAPPTPSTYLRAKPVWKVLSDHGRRVWVLGVPSTWPAYPVNGAMMTDRVCWSVWETFFRHRDRIPGGTWPEALAEEIEPLVVRPWAVPREEIARYYEPTEADLERIRTDNPRRWPPARRVLLNRTLGMDRTVLDVFDHLAAKESLPDLAVVYTTATDLAGHAFWPHKFPERYPAGFSPPEEVAQFRDVIDRVWAALDARIGRILEKYGPGATVILVSDHGLRAAPGGTVWDADHAEEGIFLVRGPGIRPGRIDPPLRLADVAALLYERSGFPVPQDLDGKLREDLYAAPPAVEVIPSYDP